MEKQTQQEEKDKAEMTKKDNLRFANLWNKMNVRISRKLKKAAFEEIGKQPVYKGAHSHVSYEKTLHPHKVRGYILGKQWAQ